MDDQELKRLLQEWKAPDAPSHLRPARAHRGWLGWLVTGSIRVPAPAAVVALALAAAWTFSTRPEPASRPETSTPRQSGELARYPLTGPLEGFDAVLVELSFGPGMSAPEHRHPGFVLGYVLDGQMRTAVNREADQIVPAGGTFFEPTGILHSAFGSASPGAPVRILAFLVVPNGSALTVR